jgi:uncharacterized protein
LQLVIVGFPLLTAAELSMPNIHSSTLQRRIDSLLAVKQAPLWTIVAVVVLECAFALSFQLIVFPHHWLTPLSHLTHGLVNATLQANAILLIVVVGGAILLAGRLTLRDLGLRAEAIGPAVGFTLLLWVCINLFDVGYLLVAHLPVSLHPTWTKPGVLHTGGAFIAQIFGNALCEEILFRGFLTIQLAILLRRLGKGPALVLGVVLAQAVFAVIHVPLEIRMHHSWNEIWLLLPQLFATGVPLAVIYLATNNLLIAVGAHALSNEIMLICADPHGFIDDHSALLYIGLSLVFIAISYGTRRESVKAAVDGGRKVP